MDAMRIYRAPRTYGATAPLTALILVLGLVVGACGTSEMSGATGQGEFFDEEPPAFDLDQLLFGGLTQGSTAPEFRGIERWVNSPELSIHDITGQGGVVLVDFWTYTCVNCLRTLPFLADWDEKYREHGLTIVGVHTPEFEFEKQPLNVDRAIEELGVRYPVAQDNERETWATYQNNVWPAKYLVGGTGRIVYRHYGEGNYAETELAIREALEQAGADLSLISLGGVEAPERDPAATRITRELYFGYERNWQSRGVYAAQEEYYLGADETHLYVDPGAPRERDVWYAQGKWRNERESFVHARTGEALSDYDDYVAFRFVGRTVTPVLHPADGAISDGGHDVVVELDGLALTPEQAGPDVVFEGGRSIVRVREPRMYRVVQLPELGEHVLSLFPSGTGLAIYAVTFGAYTEGP